MQALAFKIVDVNGNPQLQSEVIDAGNLNVSLNSIRDYLGCDMVEHVNIESQATHNPYDLWVNENGAYENPLNFRFAGNYGYIDIYGDVVVTSTHIDQDGNLIDDGLDDFTVNDITQMVMKAFGIRLITACDMDDEDIDGIAF